MSATLKFGTDGQWAAKEGSLLAFNDENGNYKPLPFTFDRAGSATRVNKDGLIETVGNGEPRIDYKDDSKGALLLEPTRSNLIPYSEYLAVGWTYNNTSVISNSIVSPKGEISASKLLDNTVNDLHRMYFLTGESASAHTFSVFLKKGEYSKVEIESLSGVTSNITYDLLNATATSVGQIEPYENDWYRCIFPMSTTSPSNAIQIRLVNNSNTNVFVGTGTSGVHMFGAQLEQGSYATSYIPTQGSIGTRDVEYSKILNKPILQSTNQFTLFFEAKDFLLINGASDNFDNVMLVLGAGESAYDTGTGIHIYNKVWYYFNGSSAVTLGNCYNATTDSKFAISYDGTKFTRYSNGVKLGTNTTSASMVNWDTISTGGLDDAQNEQRTFNIKDLQLYNTALTDQELINLTKI